MIATEVLEPLQRLRRDVAAAQSLSQTEVRYLVDYYYLMQEDRKRAHNQVRALGESGEPNSVVAWLAGVSESVERSLKNVLDMWSGANPVGVWSKSITGIGPIIASGLLAHIDIEKAPTVGHIWRFAGLDPTTSWGKGEKRPWNAKLKVLCWHAGESFVKVQNNPNDFYGKIYAGRKALEQQRNEAGAFADQAAAVLAAKRIGQDTEAYKYYSKGELPPAHIHARAKRYAVKLFLAHWHEVAYETHYGTKPPKPYVIEHMGHVDKIEVPNWP